VIEKHIYANVLVNKV